MKLLSRILVVVLVVGGGYLGYEVLLPEPASFVNIPVRITSDCKVDPKDAPLSVKANDQITWIAQGSAADVQFPNTPFHDGNSFHVAVGPTATESGRLKRRVKLCVALGMTCDYTYTVTQNGKVCDPRVIVTK